MSEPLQIGKALPQMTVVSPDGLSNTVQSLLGPRTLLYFLHGTWCPECVGHYHLLQRYHARIEETGTKLIVVAGEDEEALRAFLQSAHPALEYAVLADPKRNAFQAIQAGGDTVAVIADPQGIVRWYARWPGHQDEPADEAILQALREFNQQGADPQNADL